MLGFKSWLKEEERKKNVEDLVGHSLNENGGAKITHNLDKLEKMLRKANHHYQHSDNIREYEKGQKEQDEIKHFIKKVGKEAVYFYNRWMKNQGLQDKGFLEFELTDSIKISEDLDKKLNPKLKELEKLLKSADWYYMYSDDNRAYMNGKKQMNDIRDLVKKIGKSGMNFYQDYLKKNGLSESKYQRNKVLRQRNIFYIQRYKEEINEKNETNEFSY
jgi:hypothetical protein